MKTLIISPHPDDEILSSGGTLLKKLQQGVSIGWIIVTSMKEEDGWSKLKIKKRKDEILKIKDHLGIKSENLYELNYATAKLDVLPMSLLIQDISKIFNSFNPHELFLPHVGDAHSDHSITFKASMASAKWFRTKSIKRIYSYETISETEQGFDKSNIFSPNVFIDISSFIDKKIKLMNIYSSEMGEFPFPRSKEAIISLARLRGASSGYKFAESFMLIKEFID